MANQINIVMATNLAIVILQFCVLGFQIYRWNEIIGAIFSIIVSFIGYFPSVLGEDGGQKWFIGFYALLLSSDLVFQIVNMILLINFQWIVIQFCIHLNVSLDISEYGGVACNDWWHFGYGEINYRDRAMIVTILMAVVIILRLTQIVSSLLVYMQHTKRKPVIYVAQQEREYPNQGDNLRYGRVRHQNYVTHI